jgi:hypothetical protein
MEKFKVRHPRMPQSQLDFMVRKDRSESSLYWPSRREGGRGLPRSKVLKLLPAGLESSTTPSWHVLDSREVKLVS